MKRYKYIKVEPVYQRNSKKDGYVFAQTVYGENNITLNIMERLQGKRRNKRSSDSEQIIFTLSFKDFGYSVTSKRDTASQDGNERFYVQYALDLMEEGSFEEYYKTALLLTKISLENCTKSFEAEKLKRKKTGYWSYPICTSPKSYIRSNALEKKVLKSIDITEEDLKHFKPYLIAQ